MKQIKVDWFHFTSIYSSFFPTVIVFIRTHIS